MSNVSRLLLAHTEPRHQPVGREDQSVGDLRVLQGVEMFPIIEVPQHRLAVLASTGAEGAVRGESDGVDVSGVTDVVGLQLAVGQVPHLDVLVPPGRHDDGVAVVGRKPEQQT